MTAFQCGSRDSLLRSFRSHWTYYFRNRDCHLWVRYSNDLLWNRHKLGTFSFQHDTSSSTRWVPCILEWIKKSSALRDASEIRTYHLARYSRTRFDLRNQYPPPRSSYFFSNRMVRGYFRRSVANCLDFVF